MPRHKAGSENDDSEADLAAEVVTRPKKGPVYKYSVEEDNAILRSFARSFLLPEIVCMHICGFQVYAWMPYCI